MPLIINLPLYYHNPLLYYTRHKSHDVYNFMNCNSDSVYSIYWCGLRDGGV
jgi:hypothetical protein